MTQTPMLAPQAASDDAIIAMWLHGRPAHTQRAYRADAERFRAAIEKPLQALTLSDLQHFADTLAPLSESSRARTLAAVKSLLAFSHRLGYLQFDVGRAMKLPPRTERLAERILSEADTQRLLALEPNIRNRTMLRLMYAAGLRVAEVCGLCWRDLQARDDAGQITVHGKGSRTRTILLPSTIWRELQASKGDNVTFTSAADAPVFASRNGRPLDDSMVWKIIRRAAQRAGITAPVSPHWLRHAHATHALERGAPIHLVQATLGHASVATTGMYLHARPTESSAKYLAV